MIALTGKEEDQTEQLTRIQNTIHRFQKYFSLNNTQEKFQRLIDKDLITERQARTITEIYTAANEVYPDRVDIQFKLGHKIVYIENEYGHNACKNIPHVQIVVSKFYLVIHFPEVSIINSKKNQIDIKDLFVRVQVDINDIYGYDTCKPIFELMCGTRTTLSLIEYENQYMHSHLPKHYWHNPDAASNADYITNTGKLPGEYIHFCTGTGDIKIAKSLLNQEYSKERLQLYLHHIETYLGWESIEGKPYISMTEVISRNYDYFDMSLYTVMGKYQAIESRVNNRDTRNPSLSLINWKFEDGEYKIIDNENFEQFFRAVMNPFNRPHGDFIYRDSKGEYFEERFTNTDLIDTATKGWIPFRGQRIYCKIEGEIKQIKDDAIKYVHPKIKNYVRQQLEFQANLSKVTEDGIKRVSQGYHS